MHFLALNRYKAFPTTPMRYHLIHTPSLHRLRPLVHPELPCVGWSDLGDRLSFSTLLTAFRVFAALVFAISATRAFESIGRACLHRWGRLGKMIGCPEVCLTSMPQTALCC